MNPPWSGRRGRTGCGDRGQIVLVAAAVVAVAFLSMTLAYAQLGYDADRTGAGAVEVASVSEVDRRLTGSLRAAAREARRGGDTPTWQDRRPIARRVAASLDADGDRLERVHAGESRSVVIELDSAAAARWARERCPDGPGRAFGPCRAIDGVVVQERADETAVVAAAFRIRIVSPAESTTATVVPRVVPTLNRSRPAS
ncbi:DUF7261 family protein [Halobellus ruber]|uniref:Uncharacterized protein n=1 Tax=Halobellus ruber TaxID=2761102 RepID=A0A7J9SMZ8_9EURY|nr:hypothetical protein [Halobellus ruber]MBB6647539.1 hypothetical protein [Halobellus ruber]